jgi:hypothetical protein
MASSAINCWRSVISSDIGFTCRAQGKKRSKEKKP